MINVEKSWKMVEASWSLPRNTQYKNSTEYKRPIILPICNLVKILSQDLHEIRNIWRAFDMVHSEIQERNWMAD